MIISIKNKKDLITIDLRCKQIRYLKSFGNSPLISFINLSNDDVEGYKYLFENDKTLFLNTLKDDILSYIERDINLKDLEVLK